MLHVDFPGGTVDKNPLANAGGDSFDLWFRKILHSTKQPSPHPTTTEPAL